MSVANLAVAWVSAQAGVTAAIVGSCSEAQARSNAAAAALELTDADRAEIESASRGLPDPAGLGNR